MNKTEYLLDQLISITSVDSELSDYYTFVPEQKFKSWFKIITKPAGIYQYNDLYNDFPLSFDDINEYDEYMLIDNQVYNKYKVILSFHGDGYIKKYFLTEDSMKSYVKTIKNMNKSYFISQND